MSPNQIIDSMKQGLDAALAHFQEEAKRLRTGRAHPSMLDGVMVSAYGSMLPLNQVATITTPEAQLIQISPYDPSNIQAIADSIRKNESLGFNPVDDGRVVRVAVPPLTTERRQQIVKQLHEKTEECNIASRQVRHEALDSVKAAEKQKQLSEDEVKRIEKQIEELMAKTKQTLDALAKSKETEIMTI